MELIVSLCLVLFVTVNSVCSNNITSSSSSSRSSTSSSSSSTANSNENGLYKTVETHDGAVRGMRKYTLFHNVSYYAFMGIPYAQPPIHDLRFKVLAFEIYENFLFGLQIYRAREGKKYTCVSHGQ